MRIALPKGRLLPQLLSLMERRNIHFTFDGERDYRPKCSLPHVEAKLLKARVIPQMLALGNFQIGFTCTDVVREANYEDVVIAGELGLNPVTIVVAVHETKRDIIDDPPRRPLVIATEYPNIAGAWAIHKGLSHITVDTTGSTEAYPPEDADIIVDVFDTGATLKANGMIITEHLFKSCISILTTRSALAHKTHGPNIRNFIRKMKEGE